MSTDIPASRAQRHARGRRAREVAPRSSLAGLGDETRDPLGILAVPNETRVPELVPLRAERMSASPFTFFRGTAALMAADLATSPHSGILVASCGDAHVSNFGFYASPERELVFDLNDFDEAAWAPWEWDLKRLLTSVVIGGRASQRDETVIERACRTAVSAYVRALRTATEASPTERYFAHFAVQSTRGLLDKASRKAIAQAAKQAQRRTTARAVHRLTELDPQGRRRFVETPPTMSAVDDQTRTHVLERFRSFLASVPADVALLFDQYTIADVAQRVVGVGSVGTRCYLVLLEDGDGHTLLMQPKQAGLSVLVEHGGVARPAALQALIEHGGQGARVVAMQHVLQALSDPFLGHVRSANADYYVRQFHDMKGGIDVEELDDAPFVTYAQACAVVLARAHSQSATAGEVVGYIGRGRVVADALPAWSYAYAEVSDADHRAFLRS
ncbi:MAG: hypothetical protein BGN97_09195 [Microbacterium sp. 69-10]|uniref:DUF2252 domain-containing protein n=1 Tax=Micrococcales TaxID=85006 RepID=UPI00095F45AC|nr:MULTISPECIES: DUF2252 domain-containing protein [Micrococcales]OJU42506.1 MAG: hypothetical protein BGN97_09195 [Microbacterium sp. 69-10]